MAVATETVRIAVVEGEPPARGPNPLRAVENFLKRDEADLILVLGNAALVALEVIEWPVAALFLAAHALHRTRFKGLSAVVEVVEEVE